METLGDGSWLGTAFEIFCVDVLLGLDNAILIALVCRSLRPAERAEALVIGAIGAALFRAILAAAAGLILRVPLLHFLGGLVLFLIALTLNPSGKRPEPERLPASLPVRSLGQGIALIILADAVMSLDNVLAVGAIAQGRSNVALIGLGLSVPLVMLGGFLLARLIDRARIIIQVGAVVVAWIGGEVAVSDPIISSWASSQAPAWSIVIPALSALFVLIDDRWSARDAHMSKTSPPSAMQ